MNFWGYPVSAYDLFQAYFDEFINSDEAKTNPKSECFIPTATDAFIKQESLKVKVLEPGKLGFAQPAWFGVTYKEDKAAAVAHIRKLVDQGVYPAALWG
jgi:hypothetical protein